jgi:hypothetical protein
MSTGSRDGKGGDELLELAIHIGRVRAGWRGFLVAGACFIIPATLIVLAFAVLYERYGSTPSGQNLLLRDHASGHRYSRPSTVGAPED